MRIAIIGTGVSGAVAAKLLSTQHDVTVFEANHYAGGHANTVDVQVEDQSHPVDTGFMVFNHRTYPNFCRLLQWLNIPSQPSDMSFSVHCDQSGLEYEGSSLNGLFAQRLNLFRPSFLRMLTDIARFNSIGMHAANSGELKDGRTVAEFLNQCGVGQGFVKRYLTPMAAAIWSSDPRHILDFPAEFMVRFFANHGLMQLRNRPRWRTIVGGSRRYVNALLSSVQDQVQLSTPIQSVARTDDDVVVQPVDGEPQRFDRVVFATHADQTLEMLKDANRPERQILSAFPYQKNEAVLHTDESQLPLRRRAWASWNYRIPAGETNAASVTYDLSRLQNHETARPILLTLNSNRTIEPSKVIRKFTYHHPAYSVDSIIAQRRFLEISGARNTYFCGAYWGYGFHEDGVNSAIAVARQFGIEFDECTVASTKESFAIAAGSL